MKQDRAFSDSLGAATRLWALAMKELRQMLRDRSTLLLGLLLPVILILLLGYGLSFDVEHAPLAVVDESSSVQGEHLVRALSGNRYLRISRKAGMGEAVEAMRQGAAMGIVRIPSDYARRSESGSAPVQLILNGVDSQTVRTVEAYVSAALSTALQKQADRSTARGAGLEIVQRTWYNEAGQSTWFLVPGIIVIVLTLVGAFLASLLIAREWERGTFESLFVTPVRPFEIVITKTAPYLLIGIVDIAICLFAARYLFDVPIRGSLAAIAGVSFLYLLVSLQMGLMISGLARSQFLASQVALIVSFLPAAMLSGFVFDLRNMPGWLTPICNILPATHFVKIVRELFLVGTRPWDLAASVLILCAYSVLFVSVTTRTVRKRLR